ncbi:unnamed protein product [Arctia plantaginis]|uniref:Uncharacterized protein n=1 Tax=Arctia plantaginis TaxID=874455 RepID=A0A8S0Z5P7_ARCPL|nr:unnamed protein product [Arctia plantaginis]CAB3237431.1 unnamed protein product [Arctia plantaginis]
MGVRFMLCGGRLRSCWKYTARASACSAHREESEDNEGHVSCRAEQGSERAAGALRPYVQRARDAPARPRATNYAAYEIVQVYEMMNPQRVAIA